MVHLNPIGSSEAEMSAAVSAMPILMTLDITFINFEEDK